MIFSIGLDPILTKFTESDIGEGKMYNPIRFIDLNSPIKA